MQARRALLLAALVAVALRAGAANAPVAIEEQLRMRIEALPEQPLAQDVRVADGEIFAVVYAANAFRPLWTKRAAIDALLDVVSRAVEEGLVPRDYHAERLTALIARLGASAEADDALRVDLDLLLTDSLLRYIYHLRFGKVDPVTLDRRWNFRREIRDSSALAKIMVAFGAEDLQAYLATILPQTPYYLRLKSALAGLLAVRARGGWPRIAPGPTLARGMAGERVRALRRRLEAERGSWPAGAGAPEEFDEALERAVAEFQWMHGFDPDGAVGPATLAALNAPADARVNQLRVNMERARWTARELEDEHLAVNIAAADVELIRAGRTVWSARVVVGKPYRETPVFQSKLTYLVFNPTWTVPPTILREDLLPRLRTDPGRLAAQGMTILDNSGRVVDAREIDWPNVDAETFPYRIRQGAGPSNPLGRVKFMLPNPYYVYLHDTPERQLFERPRRAFSSGCIRVENVVELARLVLDDAERWSREAVEQAIADGRTRTVFLSRPLTVLVLYRTVDAAGGGVRFLDDIYGRDAKVLRALDGPFVFSPPEGFSELLAPAW